MDYRIKDINSQFNYDLQRQIIGVLPNNFVYSLGYPSDILLSADIPYLPIELSASRLALKSSSDYESNHPFDLSKIKNLPQALNEPMAVFNSIKKDGSKVILTELEHNENNFIVILRVRQSDEFRKMDIEVNDIRSIYPKDHKDSILNCINNNLLKWIDKEKILRFFSTQWPNYIGGGEKTQDLNVEPELNHNTKLQNSLENAENAKKIVKNFYNPMILSPDKSIDRGWLNTFTNKFDEGRIKCLKNGGKIKISNCCTVLGKQEPLSTGYLKLPTPYSMYFILSFEQKKLNIKQIVTEEIKQPKKKGIKL